MAQETSYCNRVLTIMASLLFVFCLSAYSNTTEGDGPRFDPNDFRMRLERYINAQAGLTESEAQKFYPIYHEMKDKQRDIMQQINKLKSSTNAANTSDKEYSNILEQITEYKIKLAEIEASYYKRMCKAISPRKVYNAMMAEDSFHREMLKRFEDQNRRKRDNRQPAGPPQQPDRH